MFKTVSSMCNLDCAYCYFRESLEGERKTRRIDRGMLSKLVPEYLDYVSDTGEASLGWQGGEPTLAGLDFFEWVVDLEARNARPGMVLSNDIQTNGILIDDAWASFFEQYSFLVGVSLDGPEELHDAVRKSRGGRGSFTRVMAGLDALRQRSVDLNILCVIGPHNVGETETIFDFFSREEFSHVQLMPAMDFQAIEPTARPSYLVSPDEYGEFLVRAFDAWYLGGLPRVSIRTFDSFMQSYLDGDSDLCIHGAKCDSGLVVEHDGEVFPCDFYIHPDYSLGNISTESLRGMATSRERTEFMGRKAPLPDTCRECEWRRYCHGGCPRNRTSSSSLDFFCQSYRRLFAHADESFRNLAKSIRRRATYFEVSDRLRADGYQLPGRNDPCPCRSGRKHKVCCGDSSLDRSYLFQQPR